MGVNYEWDAETIEDGDVVDHDHRETVAELLPLRSDQHLVLVRDVWGEASLRDRSWAYANKDGTLPTHFLNALDQQTSLIPQRYHSELAKALEGRTLYA